MNKGWNWDNRYQRLPEALFRLCAPETSRAQKSVIVNEALARDLGVGDAARALVDNLVPEGATPLAMAYAGHQFGHFTMLGDGRAHLLGEHIAPSGARFDVALKGSGATPFSRGGDGRAALAPMLREYIISEALAALAIPTTRALAVIATGERVYREEVLDGALLVRVAQSHLRVGTFQYARAVDEPDILRALYDYARARHYPEAQNALDVLRAVMMRQIALVCEWLRVGFIHGVMNTDNVSIAGETIDYGPCAFMDDYHPLCVFSSIDEGGRYAFARQPEVLRWNLARFAESLLPLIDEDAARAATLAEELLGEFDKLFAREWRAMMRRKLGLASEEQGEAGDDALIEGCLNFMQKQKADYTNHFLDLWDSDSTWHKDWRARIAGREQEARQIMAAANPQRIARNHQVERALASAAAGNMALVHELLAALSEPYKEDARFAAFAMPPKEDERVRYTYCGT